MASVAQDLPSATLASLLARMEKAGAPAAPAIAVTWPATMSKEAAAVKFGGALFRMNDASYRFAPATAARGSDLIFNRKGSCVKNAYMSSDVIDGAVEAVLLGAFTSGRFVSSGLPAVLAPSRPATDGDLTSVSVTVGTNPAFDADISSAIDGGMLELPGGEPLAWEQWVPRAAAAAAVPGAAAAAPSPITKRTLSAVAGPLLLVLEALEVKPAGNKYASLEIAQLLVASGGSSADPQAMASLITGGGPGADGRSSDDWLREIGFVFGSLAGGDFAAALEQADDVGRSKHALVPTPHAAYVGAALRSASSRSRRLTPRPHRPPRPPPPPPPTARAASPSPPPRMTPPLTRVATTTAPWTTRHLPPSARGPARQPRPPRRRARCRSAHSAPQSRR